jgi:hypothetical protein
MAHFDTSKALAEDTLGALNHQGIFAPDFLSSVRERKLRVSYPVGVGIYGQVSTGVLR